MTGVFRIPAQEIHHRKSLQDDPRWISFSGLCCRKLQEQLIGPTRRRVPEVNDRWETRDYMPASIPEQDERTALAGSEEIALGDVGGVLKDNAIDQVGDVVPSDERPIYLRRWSD